jgi:chromosome segregation ATPase
MLKLDSEMNLMKRELEITRSNLKETCALNEIEHKNIETIRDRLAVLRNEQNELENLIHHLKDQQIKEENKIKTAKIMGNEQIRLVNMELKKLQQDFKLRQRNIEEIDKQQRLLVSKQRLRSFSFSLSLICFFFVLLWHL